jgi:hypothetical protein
MKWFVCLIILGVVIAFGAPSGYSLTADEVVKLKKAGVSDKTIELMLQQEREAKGNPYDQMGVREIKDRDGNSSIIYSTGKPSSDSMSDAERERVDKAWKMLQGMIIDTRKK